jgi:DNA-binding response OmpR family regulator
MAKRILAIDDEPDTLLVIESALKGEGYEVETAEGGEKGIKAAYENPPDLITLDVMMPGMNGADVSRKLKANPATAKVPIIMLTALHEKKYIKAALLQLGVDYYIVKPFEIVDFLNKVKEALEGDPLFE